MKNLIRKILKESMDEFDWVNPESNPAEEFLYQKFMECELIESEKSPGWTKYIDKNGKILFVDNIETGSNKSILYFDFYDIYIKLGEFGLNYEEIKKLCIDMLYETHKRKVLTAGRGINTTGNGFV